MASVREGAYNHRIVQSSESANRATMNILFITANRIGDAVLSTPLLAHLIDRAPTARITVACGPAPAPLFADTPGVVRVIELVKRPRLGHWRDLWRQVRGIKWDLVVDLRGSMLAWLLRSRERRVLKPPRGPIPRVDHLARLLNIPLPAMPRLWCSDAHRDRARELVPDGHTVLAVGPTANWGGKQWAADRFVDVVAQLTGPEGELAGADVMIVGGPGEREAATPVIEAVPHERRIDLVGREDLLTIFACLARCRLYIGNDSGLMHLAAASGTPTLGLFGPSREDLYAPRGRVTGFVRTELSFDDIRFAPDYDYRKPDSHMDSLSVDKVVEAANDLLARSRLLRPEGG